MIAFWNRHEVFVGLDLARFNEVLDMLTVAGIGYKYRIDNHTPRSVGAPHTSRMLERSIMYYVYVHRKNAELANSALHQRGRR